MNNQVKGVRQVCFLSSLLFNLCAEESMKKFHAGKKIKGEKITLLTFADDIAIPTEIQ